VKLQSITSEKAQHCGEQYSEEESKPRAWEGRHGVSPAAEPQCRFGGHRTQQGLARERRLSSEQDGLRAHHPIPTRVKGKLPRHHAVAHDHGLRAKADELTVTVEVAAGYALNDNLNSWHFVGWKARRAQRHKAAAAAIGSVRRSRRLVTGVRWAMESRWQRTQRHGP